MTEIYRIHVTDNSGRFAVDCYDYDEYIMLRDSFKEDPDIYDIWVEEYDSEDGLAGMMKVEFEELIEDQISQEDYQKIETVYVWYPSFGDKRQAAALYRIWYEDL